MLGNHADAHDLFEHALGIFEVLGERLGMAHASLGVGLANLHGGNLDDGHRRLGDSLAMHRQMGHRKGIALGLRASAARANLIVDMPAEARLLRDALDEFADLGVPSGIVGCLEDCGRQLVAARKAELAVTLWAVAERNVATENPPFPG